MLLKDREDAEKRDGERAHTDYGKYCASDIHGRHSFLGSCALLPGRFSYVARITPIVPPCTLEQTAVLPDQKVDDKREQHRGDDRDQDHRQAADPTAEGSHFDIAPNAHPPRRLTGLDEATRAFRKFFCHASPYEQGPRSSPSWKSFRVRKVFAYAPRAD
jgi:hypothetical protein